MTSESALDPADATAVVQQFVAAFQAGDLDAITALLAPGFVGHITTADGGVQSANCDEFVASVRAMDVTSADLQLTVPNIVEVEPGQVLVMVVVQAERGGRSLHNFSGQLATIRDGRITELWMVDALPAESDRFWSS
jgi:ketosteroid isomerase-like protein